MDTTRTLHPLLAWLAIALAPTLTWWLGTRTWEWIRHTEWASASVDEAAITLVGATGSLVGAHLTASAAALLVAHVLDSGPRAPLARWTPVAWRRVVATAVGVSVATGVSAPAMAAITEDPPVETAPRAGWVHAPADARASTTTIAVSGVEPQAVEPAPSPTPGAPSSEPPAAPLEGRAAESDAAGPRVTTAVVHTDSSKPTLSSQASERDGESAKERSASATATRTVERGDSLWSITAGLLPADAAERDIAQAWPRLYRENREVIGDNPSLIHPGQKLTIPVGMSS